ncbi:hypothetical protein ACIBW9_00860 [Streptomyces sp. NPDC049541]|uniref:hypothetical protein n=1 Tax=Streptomyces sp. NPDC049541 TaxID=3365594 RepID=UPI0037B95448
MTDSLRLHCPNGHELEANQPASKFCTACGAPMVITCPNGHEVEPASYCVVCGAALPSTGLTAFGGEGTNTAPYTEAGGGSPPEVLQPIGPGKHRRRPSNRAVVGGALAAVIIGVGAYFGITQLTSSGTEKPASVTSTGSLSPSNEEPLPSAPVETETLPSSEDSLPASPTAPSQTPQPSRPVAPPPSATAGPGDTVEAYFAAINAGDYKQAWDLGGRNLTHGSYSAFVKSFEGTAYDSVTVVSVAGDTVEAELDATQTDGTHRYFAGTYTVRGGAIVAANIQSQ